MPSYNHVELLGEGAFGEVWKCESPRNTPFDNREHRFVALKHIKETDEHALREVDILQGLRHDGIVAYLDHFFDSEHDDLCIVMEFCDMGTLTTKLKYDEVPLEEYNVWRFMENLASALEYLHTRRIMHRDLKPDNILLKSTEDGGIVYKLGDFGLAKLLNRRAQQMYYTRTNVGTPYYIAPEILLVEGGRYSVPADIWSFGAVISAYCNDGEDLFPTFDSVVDWPREKTRLAMPFEYSHVLRMLVANMLQVDPKKRPSASKICQEAEKDFRTESDD